MSDSIFDGRHRRRRQHDNNNNNIIIFIRNNNIEVYLSCNFTFSLLKI
jgi:hypothetical protein